MRYLLFALLPFLLIACGKDNLSGKPELTLKFISSTTVDTNQDVRLILTLKDKDGDFLDTLWVSKTTSTCIYSNFIDSSFYNIPEEVPRTKNFEGEIDIVLRYAGELRPQCLDVLADTAVFSFWMKDAKGNYSDTVLTPKMIIQNK